MRNVLAPVLLALCACSTTRELRCKALREELEAASGPCQSCIARLTPGGDAALCQYLCAHSSQVGPAAVAACAPPAPAAGTETAKETP